MAFLSRKNAERGNEALRFHGTPAQPSHGRTAFVPRELLLAIEGLSSPE